MPLGADGNALSIGDEVDTNGNQPLPAAQRRSIALINAVVERHFDVDEKYAHRHQDISNTGKWDIGNLTTPELRSDAANMHEELDMPTAQEIADAVWNRRIKVNGKDVPIRLVVGRLAKQTAGLADIATSLDQLEAEVKDDATKQQVRKLRAKLDAVLAEDADEGETP
jgi:N-acetyl-anhydromuramyl-L-alanine amidase AmpD